MDTQAAIASALGVTAKDVVHWYDFICPFCYVGQHRTAILKQAGLQVIELPFQAHPEIPDGGKFVGHRSGPMYDMLNREAREAGLPLHWPERLPNSRRALAYAEWIREHAPQAFDDFQQTIFAAHFTRQQDIGDVSLLDGYAARPGVDLVALHTAITTGTAEAAVQNSERFAASLGVRGTPAWLVGGHLVTGLQPAETFQEIVKLPKPYRGND